MKDIKGGATKKAKEAKLTLANIEHFIEAASLVVISYTGQWTARNVDLRKEYYYVLVFSSLVVGLRGTWEMLKHFNRK